MIGVSLGVSHFHSFSEPNHQQGLRANAKEVIDDTNNYYVWNCRSPKHL